ncbi:heme-binding protein [Candidatus Parcubacteria bacterium]|nr:heme-binding protein [Candidatus Parcubacteria bacterium]
MGKRVDKEIANMDKKIETDVSDISTEAAEEIIRKFIREEWMRATKEAGENEFDMVKHKEKKPVAMAIVDRNGKLKAFISLDGTIPTASEQSILKAYETFTFRANAMYFSNGGILVKNTKGQVIGAIGVNGRDSMRENHELAILALEIFESFQRTIKMKIRNQK